MHSMQYVQLDIPYSHIAMRFGCSAHHAHMHADAVGRLSMLLVIRRGALRHIRGVQVPGAGAVQDPVHRADYPQQRSGAAFTTQPQIFSCRASTLNHNHVAVDQFSLERA